MKARGKREKGRRLELKVAEIIRRSGADKDAKRMPLSGGADGYKSDIYTRLPYSFECKNQEKIRIWEWWKQAEEDAGFSKTPVLVFSSNHRPIMACLKLDDLIILIAQCQKELRGEKTAKECDQTKTVGFPKESK